MVSKTQGLVLGSIRYKETSLIVKIYTQAFGLQAYIQNSVRKANARTGAALFQPMMLLDMVVYHDDKKQLHRISELKVAHVYQTVHTEPYKIATVSFIAEVVNKCVHENQVVEGLYDFIFNAMVYFDLHTTKVFHLIFLVKMTSYLGFGLHHPTDVVLEDTESAHWLQKMIDQGFRFTETIPHTQIRTILDALVQYYGSHVASFGELKALKVLREI